MGDVEKARRRPATMTCGRVALYGLVLSALGAMWRLFDNGESLMHLVPNLLMFSGSFETTVHAYHQHAKVDKRIHYPPIEIPSINAEDFDMTALRLATDNFRYPAVVKGLFKGTRGYESWADPDYLPSRLGKYVVPVVKNSTYNNNQMGRAALGFGEAFRDIVVNHSPKYLFFPVQSREQFEMGNFSTGELQRDINDIVREDLELDRIFPGFGTRSHRRFYGSQLVVGYGQKNTKKTTGTGWHCAMGNNYFAMVVGKKRWYFVDPRYSAYMAPVKGGRVNVQTVRRDLDEVTKHLPLRYGDIEAGDLLYNPDWEWHTIQNYEGLSLGVPIRELYVRRSIRNNALFSFISIIDKLMEPFGFEMGGYPMPGHGLDKLWRADLEEHEEL